MEDTSRQSGVQSIDRAITILDCFSLEIGELSLGEIAQAAQLPKPTVYRLLSALKKHHWIEQDDKTGAYRLGFRLYTLGAVVGSQMDLRRSALPLMQRLAEETQETVNLNLIDRGERICMELVEGSHAIRNFVKIGTRNSLVAGASGKVLLAHLPEDEAMAVLDSELALDAQVSRQQWLAELAQIRRQGYAVTYSDRIQGACGISAPIWGKSGQLLAGMTISGPEDRMREAESELVAKLLTAAEEISARMGHIAAPKLVGR